MAGRGGIVLASGARSLRNGNGSRHRCAHGVNFAPRTHPVGGPATPVVCVPLGVRDGSAAETWTDTIVRLARTGHLANPKTGAGRRHVAPMDASASASPVAVLSYVIGERSSASRRRPNRSQIYKISGFVTDGVRIDAWRYTEKGGASQSPCVAVRYRKKNVTIELRRTNPEF